MRKTTLINPALSEAITSLGHTDMLVLADAGLPIPPTIQRIDLALANGIPTFLDTLSVVLSEMYVEKAIVAQEMKEMSPTVFSEIEKLLRPTPIEVVRHVDFKKRTQSARAIVRTGEFTPYANIILVSGAWGFNLATVK